MQELEGAGTPLVEKKGDYRQCLTSPRPAAPGPSTSSRLSSLHPRQT